MKGGGRRVQVSCWVLIESGQKRRKERRKEGLRLEEEAGKVKNGGRALRPSLHLLLFP